MPTTVEIPDIGKVQFPDDMSHDEIVDAIKTKIIPQYEAEEKDYKQVQENIASYKEEKKQRDSQKGMARYFLPREGMAAGVGSPGRPEPVEVPRLNYKETASALGLSDEHAMKLTSFLNEVSSPAAEFTLSPQGEILAGATAAAPVLAPIVGAGFLAQSIKESPEAWKKAATDWVKAQSPTATPEEKQQGYDSVMKALGVSATGALGALPLGKPIKKGLELPSWYKEILKPPEPPIQPPLVPPSQPPAQSQIERRPIESNTIQLRTVEELPPLTKELASYDAELHDRAVENVEKKLASTRKRPTSGELFRLYHDEYKRLESEQTPVTAPETPPQTTADEPNLPKVSTPEPSPVPPPVTPPVTAPEAQPEVPKPAPEVTSTAPETPKPPPEPPQPNPDFSEPGSPVSNMFAAIDRDRVAAGKPPMEKGTPRTWSDDEKIALQRMNDDPEYVSKLIEDVNSGRREDPLSSTEHIAMTLQKAKWKADFNEANRRFNDANSANLPEDAAKALVDRARAEDNIVAMDQAVGRGGTGSEAGRRLAAQKVGITDDLDLVSMRAERRALREDGKLTPEDEKEIDALYKEYEEKLAKVKASEEAAKKSEQEALGKLAMKEAEEASRPEPTPPHIQKIVDRIRKVIKDNANESRAYFRGKMLSLSPQDLYHLTRIAADNLMDIGADFAKWSSKMVSDLGEWVKPHLQALFEAANHGVDKEVDAVVKPSESEKAKRVAKKSVKSLADQAAEAEDKIKAKVESQKGNEITPLVKKLAEHFYSQGITKLEPMISALHDVLKRYIPDIDRLQTMDALSGRGKFTLPNPDVLKKGVRELSAEARVAGHIEQLMNAVTEEQKKLPKTGPQRDKPTANYRQLQQKLNELMKKLGVRTGDPETQLASALQAAKTYTRNRIADLKQEIATRERIVKSKTTLQPDEELTALRKELETLRSEHEAVFGKRQMTDEQRIAAANRMLDRQISSLESDLEKGILNRPKAPSKTPETPGLLAKRSWLSALREYRQELRDSANPKRSPEEIKLQAIKTRIATQTAEYNQRLASGDFETRPKRTPVVLDEDATKAKAELERLKEKWKEGNRKLELSRRPTWQKVLDKFVSIERAFKLSSPVVFGKLTAAAFTRFATTLTEEVVGSGLSKALPELASRAPREGGINVKAMAKGLTEAITKGMKDAYDTLIKGETDVEVAAGNKQKRDRDWMNIIGQVHGMIKAPVKRAEFTLSLEKRIAHAIKNGVDVTDPAVQTRLLGEALDDGYRSIFMQDNFAARKFNNLATMMELDKKAPILGKVSAATMRFLLPIVRVPMNIVSETAQGIYGVPVGSIKLVQAMRNGIRDLPPEQADAIMRNLKKGSIGAALMALGYLSPENVGGYDWREKRQEGDVKTGGFKVFDVNMPRWMTHAPWFELMQFGATIRHVKDQTVKATGDSKGIDEGLWAAGFGLLEQTPFYGEMLRAGRASEGTTLRNQFLGELLKGTLEPAALQKIAEWSDEDVKRNPKTITEHLEMGIPGLRQNVPEKIDKRR